MDQPYIPDNLPECFTILEQEISVEEMERLRRCKQNELALEHFGWGMFLRNRFIHPSISPIRDKISALPWIRHHADDYGDIILKSLWLYLRGKKGSKALLHLLEKEHESVILSIKKSIKPGEEQEIQSLLSDLMEEKPKFDDISPLFSK